MDGIAAGRGKRNVKIPTVSKMETLQSNLQIMHIAFC